MACGCIDTQLRALSGSPSCQQPREAPCKARTAGELLRRQAAADALGARVPARVVPDLLDLRVQLRQRRHLLRERRQNRVRGRGPEAQQRRPLQPQRQLHVHLHARGEAVCTLRTVG
jgi:hypothetical protein